MSIRKLLVIPILLICTSSYCQDTVIYNVNTTLGSKTISTSIKRWTIPSFSEDSIIGYPARIDFMVGYTLDSTCAVTDIKISEDRYDYLRKIFLSEFAKINHVVILNGMQQPDCREVAIPHKIPSHYRLKP